MPTVKRYPERRARRLALGKLNNLVTSLENAQLDGKDLRRAKVSVQPMSFDESGSAKLQPGFFRPVQAELLRNPGDIPRGANNPLLFPDIDRELGYFGSRCGPMDRARDLDDYLTAYHGSSFCMKTGAEPQEGRDLEDGNFGRLFESSKWVVTCTSEVPKHPHVWATVCIGIDADERLLRAELLTCIRIMQGRMHRTNVLKHKLAPVLLFSSFGPQHGRILQAHFDGEQMIIFKSKIYDFRHQNDAQAKLFAQWALSEPIGDTR